MDDSASTEVPTTRWTTITPYDHSTYIWIVSICSILYSLSTFLGRCSVKWKMFGADDWALTVGQLFATGHAIAVFISTSSGLGKAVTLIDPAHQTKVADSFLASQLLLLAGLCMSKCSVILLIRRVFTRDLQVFYWTSTVILVVLVVWGIASMIAVSAACMPEHIFPGPENLQCPNDILRWKLVVIFDVITEAVIIVLPLIFVSPIRMSLSHKARVVLAFLFRAPSIPFALLFLTTYTRAIHTGATGTSLVAPIIWQQAELCWSLISATVPCMRAFIRSFSKTGGKAYEGYGRNNMLVTDGSGTGMGDMGSGSHRPQRTSWKSGFAFGSAGAALSPSYGTSRQGILPRTNEKSIAEDAVTESATNYSPPGSASAGGYTYGRRPTSHEQGDDEINLATELESGLVLRPERLTHETVIYHPKSAEGRASPVEREVSYYEEGSQGSGEGIRKDTGWDVRSEAVGYHNSGYGRAV
ncbi:hypothetical protein K402DRAFT_388936 [Aulographum hederae CBS 113979]|uniref:Rhodopsin domain-containing protein n=1 Tax=Aulographum hederae CBS 113979 TaxID=1176131 RepID=A0A6G1HEE1_9PEZI|nr:hypothetical protein K402DRAFT_388936 [Aulographum hederae CBS 113979]